MINEWLLNSFTVRESRTTFWQQKKKYVTEYVSLLKKEQLLHLRKSIHILTILCLHRMKYKCPHYKSKSYCLTMFYQQKKYVIEYKNVCTCTFIESIQLCKFINELYCKCTYKIED